MVPDKPSSSRRVRSIIYEHDGDKYEVTVGNPRKVYPSKTGPRGGYIKNTGHQSWGTPTGSPVTRIEAGDPFLVYSEEPSDGWANPSVVGGSEIKGIGYFDDTGPAELASD